MGTKPPYECYDLPDPQKLMQGSNSEATKVNINQAFADRRMSSNSPRRRVITIEAPGNHAAKGSSNELLSITSAKIFNNRHSHIVQEQSLIQASFKNFRERAEEEQETISRMKKSSMMSGRGALTADRSILFGKSSLLVQKLQVLG